MPKLVTRICTGVQDGANTLFQTPTAFVQGTLILHLNGLLASGLLAEEGPGPLDFTTTLAPESTDTLEASYMEY